MLAALPPGGSGSLQIGLQHYRVSRSPWRAASLLTQLAFPEGEEGPRPDEGWHNASREWTRVQQLTARLTIVTLAPFRRHHDIRRRLALHGLSPREVEVAAHSLLSGFGNGELARKLCVSEETVKSHLHDAYRRIGVSSRLELIVKVLGLSDDPAPYPGEQRHR